MKYTFDTTERNGTSYVIAQPRNQQAEPVRFNAEWIQGDDVSGEWEVAVGAIIRNDLIGGMELEEGNGRLPRQQAIETLAAATNDDGNSIVANEEQAEALIEYFAVNDILSIENGDVVLLKNPERSDISAEMMLNWAAGIDACIDEIEATMERVERAQGRLEEQLEKIDTDAGAIDERLKEVAQELQSLGDGSGVPTDPSELPEDERQRYRQLKRKFIYHNQMQEVESKNLTEQVRKGAVQLSDNLEMLESARDALTEKRTQVRTMAMSENVFPDDALGIVENMGNLATQLAGVGNVDEKIEGTDGEEFASMVSEVAETTTAAAEAAKETAESDEHTTDLQL